MQDLLRTYLPHAPRMGLYVAPDLPDDRVRNALRDYARQVHAEEVVALFDATLMGSGKDGVVFTSDRLVFQNHDLQPPQTIRYDDIVGIDVKRKLLGGKEIRVSANSASATVTHTIDFSGKPEAVEYVARFLREAMLASTAGGAVEEIPDDTAETATTPGGSTDTPAVLETLAALVERGQLSVADYEALRDVLRRRQGDAPGAASRDT